MGTRNDIFNCTRLIKNSTIGQKGLFERLIDNRVRLSYKIFMLRKARIDAPGALHHNPLRAKLVSDLKKLDKYPYCGHSALIGKTSKPLKQRIYFVTGGTLELGMTTVELAKKLNLAQPTISQSAMRGRKAAVEAGFKLSEQIK